MKNVRMTPEQYDLSIRRINELQDQIDRLKYVLKCMLEGIPFEDTFNEEVYTEDANNLDGCKSHISVAMAHVLKLKYCINNRNHWGWKKEVDEHRDTADQMGRLIKNPDGNIAEDVKNNIDDIYDESVKIYKREIISKKRTDLVDGLKYIPDKCPWNFEDITKMDLCYLLDKLPDPDELTVQMQLYPSCKESDGGEEPISSNMKMRLCSECKFYSECIAEYYSNSK